MTRNRNLLFVATAAAALMMSASAFAQSFAPYGTSYQPVKDRTAMQSGRVKLYEGRSSAVVPSSEGYGYTDTSREWQIHAN
jgi:ABC-type sugar transport system substrate-binding protein